MMDELPFILQRHIMEFWPNLPRVPVRIQHKVRLHLNRKYCSRCGEYIDIPQCYEHRKSPIHIHYGKKGLRDDRRLILVRPTIQDLMPYGVKARIQSSSAVVYDYDVRFMHVSIVFIISGPRHFYNMRRLLRSRSRRMTLMKNAPMTNIFHNPKFHLSTTTDIDAWTRSKMENRVLNSTEHRESIARVFCHVVHGYPCFFDTCLDSNVFIDHGYILYHLVQEMPHIMSHLMYVPDFPASVYQNLIRKDLALLDYFTEEKLAELFAQNQDFFFDLFTRNARAADFFYFDRVRTTTPII